MTGMTNPIGSDTEALAELQADNQRRLTALAEVGMRVNDLPSILQTTMLEHLLVAVDGEMALLSAKLDFAGRLSRILDDAEKQAEKQLDKHRDAEARSRLLIPPSGS